jgi:hypothetical protein
LSEFLQGLPLVDLTPDSRTVKHAGGVFTHMLSTPNGEYAMYIDGDGPADVTLSLPAGEYAITWIDVSTGVKTGERFRHGGGDKTVRSPKVRGGVAGRLTRKGGS